MTDLERHWDDLPVGPAPVDAILREARRQATIDARRRPGARLKRSLGRVTVLGGVAAAFVAGTLVAQSGSPVTVSPTPPGSGAPTAPDVVPAAFHGELQAPASCEELLDHYVDRSLDLVTTYGWGYGWGIRRLQFARDRYDEAASLPVEESGDALRIPQVPRTSGAYGSDSGTNVQEAGVDEPDSVKTDGRLLVRLREAELTTYDVTGAEVVELGRLDLGDFHDGEILLAGDTVVALGNDGTPASHDLARYPYYDDAYLGKGASAQTRVLTVDISDPVAPALTRTVDYDASLVAARLHGTGDVRLVLSKGLPDLAFTRGRGSSARNRALVAESILDDWLPHVSVDGGEPTDLLDCDRVAIPRAEIGLGTMAVVGFTAGTADDVQSLGLAGDASMTYESADHLYLAAGGGSSQTCLDLCDFSRFVPTGGFDGTTHVYDFALAGTGASYVGAGEVEGTVRDRWSMDEAGGVLRLAVGPSSETGDYNSIVTLRADGDELVELGRLDGLGRGEDIKSVRWFDGLALLVTFREVDPLYAVDLTDDADPTLLGELKIPGFSSYLHPLGTRRVVGVGSDGRGFRAQAGLFDVTDLTDPRRLDVVEYGNGTYARAGEDPRQFTWLPGRRVVLTVISRGRTGYVSRIQLDRGTMVNQMTKVEFGRDVDDVRLVPLPGAAGLERVALVTGEDVEFFDVGDVG